MSEANILFMIFNDEETIRSVMSNVEELTPVYIATLDYVDDKDVEKGNEIINKVCSTEIRDNKKLQESESGYLYGLEFKRDIQQMYMDMFGSLFFLGIFLGVLFLMAAILIMYYKQLSEGYEDQKRFEIMQNVGMSQKEVKQTIQSQVLIFFFLPLVVAVIHMAFAFKMIVKMMGIFLVSEISLFIWCTVISVIILAIIYSIIYFFTAKTYYKIVQH